MRRLRNGVLATGLVLSLTALTHGQVCPTTLGMAGGTTGRSSAGTTGRSSRAGAEFPPVGALSNLGPQQQASMRQQMLLARARRAAMLRAGQNQVSLQFPAGMGVLAQTGQGAANNNQQPSTSGQDASARSSRAAARRAEAAARTLAYAQTAESQNRFSTATKYYRRVLRVAPGSTAAGEAQQALDRLTPGR